MGQLLHSLSGFRFVRNPRHGRLRRETSARAARLFSSAAARVPGIKRARPAPLDLSHQLSSRFLGSTRREGVTWQPLVPLWRQLRRPVARGLVGRSSPAHARGLLSSTWFPGYHGSWTCGEHHCAQGKIGRALRPVQGEDDDQVATSTTGSRGEWTRERVRSGTPPSPGNVVTGAPGNGFPGGRARGFPGAAHGSAPSAWLGEPP